MLPALLSSIRSRTFFSTTNTLYEICSPHSMYCSTFPSRPTLKSAWFVLRRIHISFLRCLLLTDEMSIEFEVIFHCIYNKVIQEQPLNLALSVLIVTCSIYQWYLIAHSPEPTQNDVRVRSSIGNTYFEVSNMPGNNSQRF